MSSTRNDEGDVSPQPEGGKYKISSSFSNTLANERPDMDESFKIGDFSAKHFTRSSSHINTSTSFQDADDSGAKKIEGGFKKMADSEASRPNTIFSTHKKTNELSGLSNLISSSLKNETVLDLRPPAQNLSTMLNNRSPSPSHSIPYFSRNGSITALDQRPDSPQSMKPSVISPEVNVHDPHPSTVEVVGRHLVGDDSSSIFSSARQPGEEFDSLQLQGGDVSREVYNWQREHAQAQNSKRRRSQSSTLSPNGSFAESDLNVHDIRVPGGFRRSFLVQKAQRNAIHGVETSPTFLTRNFIEFLTLYGHFAGEELSENEDEDEEAEEEGEEAYGNDEESLLLARESESRHKRHSEKHKASTFKATLLLLKAFIGTGVLFLPKGFSNGGWVFCSVALLLFSVLSYWCFMLLINARIKIGVSSYGDIGGKLYGNTMRLCILSSIALSQIGFSAAYTVFTATNLRVFFISMFGRDFSIKFFIFAQLLIYLPLSLTRNISKLSGTALIADLFILLGLIYVYYYCSFVVVKDGISQVSAFNNEWSVFIGTAIFTYEGIGLLIPIQESMAKPSKFPLLLFWVMVGATVVFVTIGGIGYMAFGAETETVILLNFPKENVSVSIVQFLYAAAILLSTPIQLFPAIKILENGVFKKSGKFDNKVKWKKNYFRIFIVIATILISWGGAKDLDKFVALVGSFACVPLIYIYPPLLHYKLAGTSRDRYLDVAITVIGSIMFIYTSGQTLLDLARG